MSHPPVDAGWVAFVALTPLLFALRRARPRRGALLGVAFGLVYYGVLLAWLLPFGVIAWLPLVVSQALYAGLFGLALPVLRRHGGPWLDAVQAAALWTAVDWARSTWPVGGFTWGGLGYSQHGNPLVLPLASVTGVWGVTFVVLAVNALVVHAAVGARRWGRAVPIAVAGALVLAPATIPLRAATGPRVDIAVVQGNVPSAMASDLLLRGNTVERNELSLHRTLAGNPPALAVWPENSLDEDPTRNPALGGAISRAVRLVGAPTLVGGVRVHGRDLFNTVFAYSRDGRIVGTYDKLHLVPFGEYVPLAGLFGWTERYRRGNADFTPGSMIRLFHLAGTTVGTPICFENTFPELFPRFVAAGATVMIASTNDSSFARSPASDEHVIFSQLRAVETGRWVVQAAVSGRSAVVDPRGRVIASTGLFQRTVLRRAVPTSNVRTVYTRLGDWFPWACGVGCLGALAWAFATRRRRGPAPPAGEEGRRGIGWGPAPISGGADPRVLVVLPTYNERATVVAAARGALEAGPHVDVLVVDDASPDGTGDVVAALVEREPRVRLLRREGKRGLASAYMTGFATALEGGYDLAVEMDADLSHRPEDLPGLLHGAERFDLTIGSRYVPGGEVSNWGRARVLLSKGGNAYTRAVLRLPIRDATSGFRVYRRALVERLVADRVHSDGYAFQIELAYRAWRMGFSIGEVPITFREREHGTSKLSRRIVVEALLKVAQWGVRDRLPRPRGK